jgi:hypothetical protein
MTDDSAVSADPREWRSALDPQSGRRYWYHRKTRVSTWVEPACLVQQHQQPAQHTNERNDTDDSDIGVSKDEVNVIKQILSADTATPNDTETAIDMMYLDLTPESLNSYTSAMDVMNLLSRQVVTDTRPEIRWKCLSMLLTFVTIAPSDAISSEGVRLYASCNILGLDDRCGMLHGIICAILCLGPHHEIVCDIVDQLHSWLLQKSDIDNRLV